MLKTRRIRLATTEGSSARPTTAICSSCRVFTGSLHKITNRVLLRQLNSTTSSELQMCSSQTTQTEKWNSLPCHAPHIICIGNESTKAFPLKPYFIWHWRCRWPSNYSWLWCTQDGDKYNAQPQNAFFNLHSEKWGRKCHSYPLWSKHRSKSRFGELYEFKQKYLWRTLTQPMIQVWPCRMGCNIPPLRWFWISNQCFHHNFALLQFQDRILSCQ